MSNKDNVTNIGTSDIDPDEYSAMETEAEKAKAEENIYEYTHVFKKPFEYDGNSYKELHFDFDSLTGQDISDIDDELERRGINVAVRELNGRYHVAFATRACQEKIGADAFMYMRASDFMKISRKVKTFLLVAE